MMRETHPEPHVEQLRISKSNAIFTCCKAFSSGATENHKTKCQYWRVFLLHQLFLEFTSITNKTFIYKGKSEQTLA